MTGIINHNKIINKIIYPRIYFTRHVTKTLQNYFHSPQN